MPKGKNIVVSIGEKYGKLTVIEDLGMVNFCRMVSAVCECGNKKPYRLTRLIAGYTKSCGCIVSDLSRQRMTDHGLTGHPLFGIWMNMKRRCYDTKNDNYKNYGGIGVIICDEWLSDFKSFYDWAIENGWRRDLQIDKDKNSPTGRGLIYSPEYCCFLTPKENCRARKNTIIISYNGENRPLIEWCEILKKNYNLIRGRIYAGWQFEKAIEII